MDDSTENVTLYAGFIFDVLKSFEVSRKSFAAPLFEMAKDLDPTKPTERVPIRLYNTMCQWIEDHLGSANIRKVGIAIGDRAYDQMTADGGLGENPTPIKILEELKRVASFMIQDPKDRGWEILKTEGQSVVMRRTQTFNCLLQEGLLHSLVKRTGVTLATVDQVSCTHRGDEFCDYLVKWT